MADKHFEYEFFGPYGPGVLMLALPWVVLGLVYSCNSSGCLQLFPEWQFPGLPKDQKLYTHEAMLAVAGFFALIVALHILVPGTKGKGVMLPDGTRLGYKLNAFRVFMVVYSSAFLLSFGTGALDLGWAFDNFLPLATAAILFSSVLSVYLYVASFGRGRLLAAAGNSGVGVYDFWMGRELNPRWGSWLDLKEFCELYPGMIGWTLLNLAAAYRQYTSTGHVTYSLLLVNAFHLWYVLDTVVNEPKILTTMDITSEGFGFMLAFGDLAWVPFTYTTQARYLVDHPQVLSPVSIAAILAVQLIGYTIFRGANNQKDAFRRDPNDPSVTHLRTLPTKRGTKLIISGWWGLARHINYFGDWLMGLAWCLPCGAGSVVPYFYAVYFGTLLVHRERRDEHACRVKYGADWDKYCRLVPWRIIPYVY